MSGEGEGRRELPELYSSPGENQQQQPPGLRHQRLQTGLPQLRDPAQQLHRHQREAGPGRLSLRPPAQQYLHLRRRRAVYGHGR